MENKKKKDRISDNRELKQRRRGRQRERLKSNRVRCCLHEGGGPQVDEVTRGGSPHLLCKRDEQITLK